MAITSVDVNRDVLNEIKQRTGMKTDREVIEDALTMSLARARQDEFFERLASRTFDDDQLEPKRIDYPL